MKWDRALKSREIWGAKWPEIHLSLSVEYKPELDLRYLGSSIEKVLTVTAEYLCRAGANSSNSNIWAATSTPRRDQ